MEIKDYISWTGLQCDDVISVFAISKLNMDYNSSAELGDFWKEVNEAILSGLANDQFPVIFTDSFGDNRESLENSWWDILGHSDPISYLQSKASKILANERKEFAGVVFHKLRDEYELSSKVANIVLSGAGPVLSTVAVEWVLSCGDSLEEEFTDLEIFDILNVAANCDKVGNFGRRRHLKVIDAFALPEVPVNTGAAFRKIMSVVHPIASDIYERRAFTEKHPDKTFEYREPRSYTGWKDSKNRKRTYLNSSNSGNYQNNRNSYYSKKQYKRPESNYNR